MITQKHVVSVKTYEFSKFVAKSTFSENFTKHNNSPIKQFELTNCTINSRTTSRSNSIGDDEMFRRAGLRAGSSSKCGKDVVREFVRKLFRNY